MSNEKRSVVLGIDRLEPVHTSSVASATDLLGHGLHRSCPTLLWSFFYSHALWSNYGRA